MKVLRAIISIIICMLMIVSFTLLLKQMMHPRSKPERTENCVGDHDLSLGESQ